MMRIINKIYIWFKKVILNILGVIRDMINKDNEVKILAIETVRDGVKGIINISFVIPVSSVMNLDGFFLEIGFTRA